MLMNKVLSTFFHSLPVPWQINLKKEVALLYNEAGYGDTLMVGAVAREIKRKYGEVKVTVNRTKEELLRNNPNIDSIGQRYNGIDLNYHYGNVFVGNHFENNIIDVMCKKAGVQNPEHTVDIFLTADEIRGAHSVVNSFRRPVVTIHTTPGDYSNGRKLWPEGHWTVMVKLLRERGCSIIQLGAAEEEHIDETQNFLGKQNIRSTIAIIGEADLHIGIVSSLMHGAEAVKTPTIILYGGFERYTNHSYKGTIPVESNLSCAPCIEANTVIEKCPQNNRCMKEITPEMIIDKVTRVLNLSQ